MKKLKLEPYADVPGFCKSASIDGDGGIASHGYVLTPGRYVGAEAAEEDDVPFEERFAALREKLEGEFREGVRLETLIGAQLKRLSQNV